MVYRLIALVAFCVFGAVACAENVDIATHENGDIELFNKYFSIDKDFISDGYISLSIKPDLFIEFKKNKCKVFADFDYVVNNSTSFSVLLRDLDFEQLIKQKIMIGKADKNAVIAFLYGKVKGSCAKASETIHGRGYSFSVADILKIAQ